MIAEISHNLKKYKIDLENPLDISIAINVAKKNVNAWYLEPPKITPHEDNKWIASVKEGAAINFNNISFNPHSHITHTECVGHITEKVHSINQSLNQYFFLTEVVTIVPENYMKDTVISKKQLEFYLNGKNREAIVIRTLPNTSDKKSRQYSHTNPPYLLEEAAIYLKQKGIKHLLIDLPSIDREKDGGRLLAHNAFWNTNGTIRLEATITELIYVPNHIKDGLYFLNLMIAPFENDATPSKPILYKILED